MKNEQKPVVWLDFDGVLHRQGADALSEDGKLLQNPELFCWLPLLEEALKPYPDVKIIVSSDWHRLCTDGKLIELLGGLGERFAGVLEARGGGRAAEILTDARRRGLTRWIALDDHASVRDAEAMGDPRFIACDPLLGISDESVIARLQAALDLATASTEVGDVWALKRAGQARDLERQRQGSLRGEDIGRGMAEVVKRVKPVKRSKRVKRK